MKLVTLLSSIALLTLTFSSCSKSDGEDILPVVPQPTPVTPPPAAGPTVYAVGTAQTPGTTNPEAVLWKNQVATPLTLPTGNRAAAYYLAISGTDVYIAGADLNATPKMTYWKNQTWLFSGDNNSVAEGFAVSGSDIHVGGYETTPSFRAAYWKNGVKTLYAGGFLTYSYDLFLNGTDVYLAGYIANAIGDIQIGYWKNGTFVSLTPFSTSGDVYSIIVKGTDVYVTGQNEAGAWGYWKNGVFSVIPGSLKPWAIDIAANGDVYVGGTESVGGQTQACFWKNGVKTNLNGTATSSTALCLTISGSDVYMGGNIKPAGSTVTVPTVWKNGTPQSYPGNNGNIWDVVVMP